MPELEYWTSAPEFKFPGLITASTDLGKSSQPPLPTCGHRGLAQGRGARVTALLGRRVRPWSLVGLEVAPSVCPWEPLPSWRRGRDRASERGQVPASFPPHPWRGESVRGMLASGQCKKIL